MGESIFEGDVGGCPLVPKDKIFANERGKRGLPCEGTASVRRVIDEEGDGCCGEGLSGGARVEEG